MNKAERAILACREAAAALSDCPIRGWEMLGRMVNVENLIEEANFIEHKIKMYEDALTEVSNE